MELNKELHDLARNHGVSYFGVAELSGVQDILQEQGGIAVTGYPNSISLGIALLHPIVDKLTERHEYANALNYRKHAYELINERLDLTASLMCSVLQGKGYRALPIPASERVDNTRICAAFSHKLGAKLAGLGWIGKSCLLVTPDNGPRVRWTTILTDAPLQPAEKQLEVRCGNCRACVDICPVQAFTGRNYADGEPREMRYDAGKCDRYFKEMKDRGELAVCGMCLYVCPHGRNNNISKRSF